MQVGRDVARRILGRRVELRLARLRLAVLAVVEPVNGDAVLAVDLGLAVRLDLLLPGLAGHLHDGTFEVLLVVGFHRVLPVVASVAVDFSDHLDDQGVGMRVRVRVRRWRRRRGVVVRRRKRLRRRR